MNTKKAFSRNPYTEDFVRLTKLLEKIESLERIQKANQAEKTFSIPDSSPTQGTNEVKLPLSYRQLPWV